MVVQVFCSQYFTNVLWVGKTSHQGDKKDLKMQSIHHTIRRSFFLGGGGAGGVTLKHSMVKNSNILWKGQAPRGICLIINNCNFFQPRMNIKAPI